jgi:hypothetical protein
MSNVDYPFWAEFEYFLSNNYRYGNAQEILQKLSSQAPLELDINKAWENWRDFRSAQFEVTAIFLIERYFGGKTIRFIPQGKTPMPDFEVQLNPGTFMIEAKTQSGQQHGDKHPRGDDFSRFHPKDETDLRSWLFEEKISSRNGKVMEPMVKAAEKKVADILICQTDYIKTKKNFLSQISVLCPQNKLIEKTTLYGTSGKPIEVWFFQVSYPCAYQLKNLKEIWLCNLSSSDYKLVALSQQNAILKNHLKNGR